MSNNRYDLYVIGAGSAGVRLARRAASSGLKTAIAEHKEYGGTCVNVGCVPKKLFVISASFRDKFSDSKFFGWRVGENSFTWQDLISAKDREIARLNQIYEGILRSNGVDIHEGYASFSGPDSIDVDGKTYRADKIVIATGSKPVIPDIKGKEHIMTSDEAFFLESLPRSIIIVGGGYIALEFASIFSRFGVKVTLLHRRELPLRGFDNDIRIRASLLLQEKGIDYKGATKICSIERDGFSYLAKSDGGETFRADKIMYAIGRRPDNKGLRLGRAGVLEDKEGHIIVDKYFRTSNDRIYAIGDVKKGLALTPVALAEAETLFHNLSVSGDKVMDYRYVPTAVFMLPSIGCVGLSEEVAVKNFSEVRVFRKEFRSMHESLGKGYKSFMKLVTDRSDSDRVLGIHIISGDAAEMIQGFAAAMVCGARRSDFMNTVSLHPTSAEELVTIF